jgi:NAD(P)-dependent dehydrogenase (short-subunit alcohol dehydrogenase family)
MQTLSGRTAVFAGATAGDMAGIICFYASEESGYITGQTTQLSGGLNLGR